MKWNIISILFLVLFITTAPVQAGWLEINGKDVGFSDITNYIKLKSLSIISGDIYEITSVEGGTTCRNYWERDTHFSKYDGRCTALLPGSSGLPYHKIFTQNRQLAITWGIEWSPDVPSNANPLILRDDAGEYLTDGEYEDYLISVTPTPTPTPAIIEGEGNEEIEALQAQLQALQDELGVQGTGDDTITLQAQIDELNENLDVTEEAKADGGETSDLTYVVIGTFALILVFPFVRGLIGV